MTIEVKYQQTKTVIIHEISIRSTADELVEFVTLGLPGPFPALYWVNGVLLSFNALIPTESVTKELMEGRIHWGHVICAPLAEYQNDLPIPNRGAPRVSILDVSHNETFRVIGDFLKQKIESN